MDFLFLLQVLLTIVGIVSLIAAPLLAKHIVKPIFSRPQAKAPLSMDRTAISPAWGKVITDPKREFGYEYEDIAFTTHGGSTCRGWFVDARQRGHEANHDTLVILCHGGGRDRRAWLRHLPIFVPRGYSCLMFDFRCHGASDGSGLGTSFGIREHRDVIAAFHWAKETLQFKKIVLCGTSVGAASVLGASVYLSKEDGLRSIIAENPFSSIHVNSWTLVDHLVFWNVISRQKWWRYTLVYPILFVTRPITLLLMWLYLEFTNTKEDKRHTVPACDAITRIKDIPILVMHGTADGKCSATDLGVAVAASVSLRCSPTQVSFQFLTCDGCSVQQAIKTISHFGRSLGATTAVFTM